MLSQLAGDTLVDTYAVLVPYRLCSRDASAGVNVGQAAGTLDLFW